MNTRSAASTTPGTPSLAARVAQAWADCRYANRRFFELQNDPTGRRTR